MDARPNWRYRPLSSLFGRVELERHMLAIRQLAAMALMLSAAAAIAQQQGTGAMVPEDAPERVAANADDAIDGPPGEAATAERCAGIAIAERLAPVLREMLDQAQRSQVEAYRDVGSLEAVVEQLEAALGTASATSLCETQTIAFPPRAAPSAQHRTAADERLLLEELQQDRDGPFPDGVRFPPEALTCRFYRSATVDHMVEDPNGDLVILLTSVAMNDSYGRRFPNIVHRAAAGHWVRTPIPRSGDGWTHVHVSRDLQHVLLLMDHTQESADQETRSVVSADRGRTWQYGESITKYVYSHHIHYFTMNETGSGTAIEYNDGDVGGYDDLGYYIFRTKDWGLTWSDRERELAFDTSGYADVSAGRMQRRSSETPLSELSLPGFGPCPDI